ncbi:N-acetylglucosamine kinase [Tenacibaculum dicentrarchi]|uniref:N-acetylglucosamine kinase n=1 Tax=Tenacibaculum dicentrarchi TaxID=669041 RepID=A0ABP1ERQ8_9FLAO|nr:N-acetylglucosamine kinase [Tenacibaculum dicentrarchi]MCD8407082.1 N-acetylglucosamine kinase [Tenacibaculum dicentrarchi]MCD8413941.1 N-acetylglucosamine kinase [Tenacibaculum dicentrarchi]MCD8419421.1 N-acetylglucosamine kinase [Tenacibaculum dicentrarchi]MCD8424437.1 N-acetylglucosamine kinase [Tenacibaculum dicentrarchi]
MILIADGGSTKVDWIALNESKKEVFSTQTLGLNPNVISKKKLLTIIENCTDLKEYRKSIKKIYFYGAGCGTETAKSILNEVLNNFFSATTNIVVKEDILGAVYASAKNKKAIVCILGTGSNSCYFNGKNLKYISPSLGYSIMDEASGNYFGKKLLRDFFYKKMPTEIADNFEKEFNLNPDFIKQNLYQNENPNRYLASFAKFMYLYKDTPYIKKLVKKGFKKFFNFHVLAYNKNKKTPVYFIGSIAFYFKDILQDVASKNNIEITNIIEKPINNLIEYHQEF